MRLVESEQVYADLVIVCGFARKAEYVGNAAREAARESVRDAFDRCELQQCEVLPTSTQRAPTSRLLAEHVGDELLGP